ncbi:hypothetical protein DTO021C3_976 [Paecilomyces variotii]|nr:hypothetical protein DTO021C3_976 [Paecilomyces variotii]KAJ9303929.1 hypothetical protein DTO217A2_6629 [Paecilomyces variotii]
MIQSIIYYPHPSSFILHLHLHLSFPPQNSVIISSIIWPFPSSRIYDTSLQLKSLQTALDRSSGPAVPVRGIFKRTQHPIGRDGGALIPWDGALNRTVQGS